jgi:hypothetical protein
MRHLVASAVLALALALAGGPALAQHQGGGGSGGGGGGGSGVSSVANSDGSLTISPTSGSVVASCTTATASQSGCSAPDNATITMSTGKYGVPELAGNTLTNGDWCTSNGAIITCHTTPPATSVTNGDGTLTISPTSGAVVASCSVASASQVGCSEPDNSTIKINGSKQYVAQSTTFGGQSVAPGASAAIQGNGAKLQASTGSTTSGDLVKYDANGNTIDAGNSASNAVKNSISFVIDGGGSAIATGQAGDVLVPYACTIKSASLLANASSSIVVDIWAVAFSSGPPTSSNSITASDQPTLSSAESEQDATLTGWTTSIGANSWLRYNVVSAATLTRVTVALECDKT